MILKFTVCFLLMLKMKHMQNMLRRKFLVMSMNKEITVEEV